LGLAAYQTAFAIALIMIGVGLICVSLIWWRQAETEPSEPDDAGELREFVDSLPRIDEEDNARPRIDRIRNRDSLRWTDETAANLSPRIDRLRNEESLK
jgi:hypothetical protein